eukprot:SAG11_NODE_14026_length_628_cov_0.952741_2_plen_37_part_00
MTSEEAEADSIMIEIDEESDEGMSLIDHEATILTCT